VQLLDVIQDIILIDAVNLYSHNPSHTMNHISYEYEKNLVGYCGIYCRDCVYYKNIFGMRAKDLLTDVKKNEWVKMVWETLDAPFDVDNFMAGLEWLASSPGCPGCLAGGGWPECSIRVCCQNKKIRGCFECNDYPCPEVSKDEAAHQRELIKKIKTSGLKVYIMEKRGEV
jgi:hypothetical protein